MKFPGQGFQKLAHEQDKQTVTDATENITTASFAGDSEPGELSVTSSCFFSHRRHCVYMCVCFTVDSRKVVSRKVTYIPDVNSLVQDVSRKVISRIVVSRMRSLIPENDFTGNGFSGNDYPGKGSSRKRP